LPKAEASQELHNAYSFLSTVLQLFPLPDEEWKMTMKSFKPNSHPREGGCLK
jgi:hypothetical protein